MVADSCFSWGLAVYIKPWDLTMLDCGLGPSDSESQVFFFYQDVDDCVELPKFSIPRF